MKKLLTIVSFFMFFSVGCGTQMPEDNGSAAPKEQQPSQQLKEDDSNAISINGYISPININVDGTNYSDSEDFYTQEVDRLEKLVKEQYPKHSLFFDAEVGLRDFKQGLVAYLVSSGEIGVADEIAVNGRGQFKFKLPANTDLTQSYNLRAYKRIGLRLTYKEEVISWCYNFFAEKDILVENDKSLVLRDFKTKVTKYECQTPKTSGISLPYSDMPSIPVVEAFEESETWPGYGPTPNNKFKKELSEAVVTPKEDDQEDDQEVSENIDK